MAAARKSRARRGKSGRKRHTVGKYSHWLSTGAVTVALGAAVACGGGIVKATPAWADDSSESSAAESDSTSSKTDADPGPSNVPNGAPAGDAEPKSEPPVATVSAATVEIHEDDKAKKRADVAEDLGADIAHGDDDEDIVADPIAVDPDQAGVPVELPQLTTPPPPAQKHAHEANDPPGVSATIVDSVDADQGSQPPASGRRPSAMALSNHLRAADATTPPTTRSLETTPSVPTSLLSAAVTAPMPVTSPVTLRSIVTDLLNWFGFTTFARTHPVPALPVPRIVEVLWLAVRRFSHTFANQAPIVSPTLNTPNPTNGVVTGSLNATDYNGDNLTYSAVGVPGKGTLVVDAAGNFTYTPTSLARIAAGDVDATLADATDTFTITASDGSLTATARIGVPITPVDAIAIDLPSGTFGGITGRPVFDSRGVAYLQLGPTIKQTRPDGTLSVRSWVAQINPTTGEAVAYEVPDELVGGIVIGPNGTAYQATKNSLLTFTPTGLRTTALPSGTFGAITTAPLFDSRGVAYLQLGPTIKQTRPDGTLSVRSGVAQINTATGEAVAYEVPDELVGGIVIGPNGVAYQAIKNGLLTFTSTGLRTTSLPSGTFGAITTAPVFDSRGVAYFQLGPTIKQARPDGTLSVRSGVAQFNTATGEAVAYEVSDELVGGIVIGPNGVAYQAIKNGLLTFTSTGLRTTSLPSGTFGAITTAPLFDEGGVAYLQLGPTIKQTRPDGTLSVRSGVAQFNTATGEAVAYEVPDELVGGIVIGPNGVAYQAIKNGLLTFTSTGLRTTALPSGTFGAITTAPLFDSRGVAYLQLGPTIKQTHPDGTLSVRSWVAQINPTTGEAVAYEVPDELVGDIVIGPNGTAYQATKNSLLTFTPTGLNTTALPSGTFGGITTAPLFDEGGVAYLQLGPTITQQLPDGSSRTRSWVAEVNPSTGTSVVHEIFDRLIGDVVIGPDGVAYQPTGRSLWILGAPSVALVHV